MSYTIPEYVDTQEQAILAVASAVKGEQVTGGDGGVNTALDILADTLAGENVQVPMTQQGAILALAQYVDGMVKPEGTIAITENGEAIDVAQYATADVSVSGGGGDFGPFATILNEGTAVPEVGNHMDGTTFIYSVGVGDRVICETDGAYSIAAGATAFTPGVLSTDFTALDAYVCTFEGSDDDGWTYKTVELWDGTITREEFESGGLTGYRWSFVVPELQEDELLILWMYLAD